MLKKLKFIYNEIFFFFFLINHKIFKIVLYIFSEKSKIIEGIKRLKSNIISIYIYILILYI